MGAGGGWRLVCALAAFIPPWAAASWAGAASAPQGVTARAALVMDAHTGRVLWARNPDLRLPPASTTKVMTALVAIEEGRLDRVLRVSRRAAATPASKVHLRAGQRLRLESLLYAVLLESANDASVVIAEGLAGSEAAFARRMTARARQLGARNTSFRNPHGLTTRGHYSTVRDLAILFRHALRHPTFRRIAMARSAVITPVAGPRRIALSNHNRLLDRFRVPVVGKTGYTRAAKRCFVGAASEGERAVIVAILGSTDLWNDARRLLDYGLGARELPAAVAEARHAGSGSTVRETAETVPDIRYEIYVGAFSQRGPADRLRLSLVRRGYRARVVAGLSGRYRVAVTGYPTLAAARRAARRLARHPQIDTPAIHRREVSAGDSAD